jgi:hypothetical protein
LYQAPSLFLLLQIDSTDPQTDFKIRKMTTQPFAPRLSKFLLEQQLCDASSTLGVSSKGAGTVPNKNKNGGISSNNNDNIANNGPTGARDNNNLTDLSLWSAVVDGEAAADAGGVGGVLGSTTKRVVSAVDHVTEITLESCHCIHLQKFLPHLLDLDLVKNSQSAGGEWDLENPVHALHLEPLMDGGSRASTEAPLSPGTMNRSSLQLKQPHPHSTSNSNQHPPFLFGEEQQRTLALSTAGIVEYWCPLDGRSSVIDDVVPVLKRDAGLSSSSTTNPLPPSATHIRQPSLVKGLPVKSPSEGTPQTIARGTSNALSPNPVLSMAVGGSAAVSPTSQPPMAMNVESESNSEGTEIKLGVTGGEETKPNNDQAPADPVTKADASVSIASTLPAAVTSTTISELILPQPPTKTNVLSLTSSPGQAKQQLLPSPLPDHRFNQLRIEEDRIRKIRGLLSSKRFKKKPTTKKRKQQQQQQHQGRDIASSTGDFFKIPGLQGLSNAATRERSLEEQEEWEEVATFARTKVEQWMDTFRLCRQSGLDEKEQIRKSRHRCRRQDQQELSQPRCFFQLESQFQDAFRCCQVCDAQPNGNRVWVEEAQEKRRRKQYPDLAPTSDDLFQCLECSFIGCVPSSMAPQSRQHILQHMLLSGHSFGR